MEMYSCVYVYVPDRTGQVEWRISDKKYPHLQSGMVIQ